MKTIFQPQTTPVPLTADVLKTTAPKTLGWCFLMSFMVMILFSGVMALGVMTAARWAINPGVDQSGVWWLLVLDDLRFHWGVLLPLAVVALLGVSRWARLKIQSSKTQNGVSVEPEQMIQKWVKSWILAGVRVGLWLVIIVNLMVVLGDSGSTKPVVSVSPKSSGVSPEISLVQSNLLFSNSNPNKWVEWIEDVKPDIIVIQEFSRPWRLVVEQHPWIKKHYPYQVTNRDSVGPLMQLGVLSRFPLTKHPYPLQNLQAGNWILPVTVTLDKAYGGQSLDLTVVHPHHPTNQWQYRLHHQFFALMAHLPNRENALMNDVQNNKSQVNHSQLKVTQQTQRPHIVLGDFNAVRWSPPLQHLKAYLKLKEVSPLTSGIWGTWPQGLPSLLKLHLDHTLFSAGINVTAYELGPSIHSDHLPILARFKLQTNPAIEKISPSKTE